MRLLLLLTTTVNFLQSPLDLVLLVRGQQTLHLDVRLLGLIIAAGGVGGVAGSLLAPWLTKRLRLSQLILISFATWSLAALILALALQPALLMTGRFLVSFIWPAYGVTVVSERLLRTPDTLRGRVNSAFRFLSFGCEPPGKALAGWLLVFLPPQLVLGFIAAAFVLCASVLGKNGWAKTA